MEYSRVWKNNGNPSTVQKSIMQLGLQVYIVDELNQMENTDSTATLVDSSYICGGFLDVSINTFMMISDQAEN